MKTFFPKALGGKDFFPKELGHEDFFSKKKTRGGDRKLFSIKIRGKRRLGGEDFITTKIRGRRIFYYKTYLLIFTKKPFE